VRQPSEAPEHEHSLNKIGRPSIISTPANSVARALSLIASARRIAPGVRLIGSRSKIITPQPSNVRPRRIGENKVLASQKSFRASPQGQHGDVIGNEHGIAPQRAGCANHLSHGDIPRPRVSNNSGLLRRRGLCETDASRALSGQATNARRGCMVSASIGYLAEGEPEGTAALVAAGN
jgi:hypothetical protein